MADYKKLSGSRVSFSLTIEESDITAAQKRVIDRFRGQVAMKGFRKGHAPDEMVVQTIGIQRLSYEALNSAIDEKYREFIIQHKIHVVGNPKVDMPKPDKKPLEVTVEVDIFPEIELRGYEKIKPEKINAEVTDKDVEGTITQILTQMGISTPVDRAAKEGDLVTIDFRGKDKEGKTLPHTDGEKMPLNLGSGQFLPDLEKAFIGMKPGEEKKDVVVKFPKDYHSPDFVGKKVLFDIKLHSVGEIKTSDLSPEIIEKITGKKQTEEEFRAGVRDMITQQKKNQAMEKAITDYQTKLLKYIRAEIPASWIENEVESRLARLKSHPQFQQDPEAFWKSVGKTEEAFKKEFRMKAENDLKIYLALSRIVKDQSIELDKDETEQVKKAVEQRLGEAKEKVDDHTKMAEVEKEVLNRKIDKYLRGLIL